MVGHVGLWLVAVALLASAVIFGWVAITTRPMAAGVNHRLRPAAQEDLVRRACADLDDEYRQLLSR